jgi:single-strand DNA-binding protein
MAKTVNKVTVLGHVGRDVEISYHAGAAIVNLTLATNEREKVDGEWRDRAEWHNVVFFGRIAEVAREYVNKGSKIYVEGRLRTRSWDGKDGVKRYKTEIIANDLILISEPSGTRYVKDEQSQEASDGYSGTF